MKAYYNENDPFAAAWLRNLIAAGHIPAGDVDERSIVDVRADDIAGYTQCHFFAGIGGWSLALRLAGWPDDRPVWTGSCPCQPFSAAGAGKAADDKRHLWPAWFPLIAERSPPVVFGEQVEAAIGWGWLDAVFADLESEGYACGATVLPACGVGAPHIRQRLWFVADSLRRGTNDAPRQGVGTHATPDSSDGRLPREGLRPGIEGTTGSVAHADGGDAGAEREQRSGEHGQRTQDSGACQLGDTASGGQRKLGDALGPGRGGHTDGASVLNGFWRDAEWIACTDGKARPVGPGSFPLAHGVPRRTSKLRAYGNAIVLQVAAEFVMAYREARPLSGEYEPSTPTDQARAAALPILPNPPPTKDRDAE